MQRLAVQVTHRPFNIFASTVTETNTPHDMQVRVVVIHPSQNEAHIPSSAKPVESADVICTQCVGNALQAEAVVFVGKLPRISAVILQVCHWQMLPSRKAVRILFGTDRPYQ